ncbi:hypothetical protein SAMN04515617_10533 [Collimonas sp. OK242]|uniref:hypothetical protein n=1 Tax=Collimonas sp. OK242 TaxID=1798195 RepID=UPI0008993CB4|nr:hypothetical protein [Collimonas sp. OK242]SDX59035.1 hypothetical protein SAMN04515617_10533 [Collimonas sp. OK242]
MKFIVLLFLFVALPGYAQSTSGQSESSFKAAVENESTAPAYAMFTLIDDATGQARTGCNGTNFLKGAIQIEYKIEYDSEGSRKIKDLILSNKDHVYRFKNQKALANIAFTYSETDATAARSRISGSNIQQLREYFSSNYGTRSLEQPGPDWDAAHNALRDAMVCALIERGLSAGIGDRTDRIWIK